MGSDWKELRLNQIINLIGGGTPKRSESSYWGGNIPWLSVKDFNNDCRHVFKTEESITELCLNKSSTKILNAGQIIISARGTVGELSQVVKPMAFNQSCYGIDSKPNEAINDFLYYLLKHSIDELKRICHGAVFDTITRETFNHILVQVPPLPEQKAIAHILGSLDDKIELNRRMNATLEGMAQALFKSWFVDFDPVIDNALAAGNPIPDELAERAEVRSKALADGTANREAAKQFPASFQFTEEMGWIPVGWEAQGLYYIANFINGAAYKGSDFIDDPDALPVVKIAEIKNGISEQTKFTHTIKDKKYRISDGEILLSWSGNPDTSIDTFVWTDGDGWLNQHIFKVSLKDEADRFFVYYQLKFLRSVFAEIARDKQTTGLGHFTGADMKRLMVLKLRPEVLTEFNKTAASLYQKHYQNRLAAKMLTKLRDTLLPKLISGELRIPEAEKLTEEALA
ncbi:MAG: restriction endonuclease subunit S [Desulfamplus sp.]|nr:restriction endonuclease subunit S [Desulfamplus sp.]